VYEVTLVNVTKEIFMSHDDNDGENEGRASDTTTDPMRMLEKCRIEFFEAEKKYHKRLHKMLGQAARIADIFDRNKSEWKEFIRNEFWNTVEERYRPKQKKDNQSSKAPYVVRYIMDARDSSMIQRAWKYAHVLDYLKHKGVAPEEVAEAIAKRGGIEKLHQKATEEKPRRAQRENDDSVSSDSDDEFTAENHVDDDDDDEGLEEAREGETGDDDPPAITVIGKRAKIGAALEIPVGSKARLTVKRKKTGFHLLGVREIE
jgi:hypothetical protein